MDACIRFVRKREVKYAGAMLLAIFAVLFFDTPRPTSAESERVITIHHDGTQETVVTDAATIGEALERAEVALHAHDVVEPAPDFKLVAPGYDVNVYRARPITVADGAKTYQIMSARTSAKQIAADAGVVMHDEDGYKLTRIDDFVTEGGVGLKLSIQRSTPLILELYGKSVAARTQSKTVEGLLKEKGVVLGAEDGTNAPLQTPITPNMTVQVWRNGVQTISEEQEVAFPTKQIRDTSRPVGFKEVQTPGVKGKKVVTYQIDMRNGTEVSRKEIQSVVTLQPKEQTETIGVQLGFTGAFQEALAKLRSCEAGGRYDRNSGNGYYGAYQYNLSTWANWQGYARPDLAPPEVQDAKAYETYQRRGWQPWPGCTKKLGLQDIYR